MGVHWQGSGSSASGRSLSSGSSQTTSPITTTRWAWDWLVGDVISQRHVKPHCDHPHSLCQLYEQPPSGPHLVQNSDCLYATYERYAVFSSIAMPVLLPVIFPQGQGWVGLTNEDRSKVGYRDSDWESPSEQSTQQSNLLLPGPRARCACLEQARLGGALFKAPTIPPSLLSSPPLLLAPHAPLPPPACTALDHRLPAKRGSYCQ